ncbi:hypothetical protein IAQ61_011561 [Plenodomus lingam]|uniref:SMP domain-containing protein n=1 Tax=Leptosphaeria maculans (strain JN3 / isolate v23.1.3 / race Av1-4-5-6-7-8) TaxID=985895 RepID=E5AAF8_LEPMJ|nr:hypothetical protein LEMA_P017790.1 [Plenodomus lingam JN3]KAH9859780.1 hypothetical protein IAQ61_011561 [Plenodomus lingam]CBY00649.1 hypothetical protein LEMA_P017790.1 [Plenodomus lingam JN3]
MSFLRTTRTFSTLRCTATRKFTTTRLLALKVDSNFISQITAAEKALTNSDEPVKGGPTAKAQSHVGQELSAAIVSDITAGEKVITNSDEPVQGGPTSVAQSALVGGHVRDVGGEKNTSNSSKILSDLSQNSSAASANANSSAGEHTGKLDSSTLSKITDAEKKLTGQDGAVQGGPTAQAQKHANEPITSQALHDITEGEKKITGGERVKGGPTSTAQSELARSRAN